MWLYFFQVLADGIQALGIINRSAFDQVDISYHPFEDVIQWKKTKGPGIFNGWKAGYRIQYIW